MKQINLILAFLFLSTIAFSQQWGAVTLVSPDPVPDPLRTDGTHYYFTFKYKDLTNQNDSVGDITITPLKGQVVKINGPWRNGNLFQFELSFTGEDENAVFSVTAENTDGNNPGTWHSGNLALPVELINFDINNHSKDFKLTWSTASEIRNDHFTLERSTDGQNFTSIGVINGSGTTSEKTDYSFTDFTVKNLYAVTTVYYRLMQTDLDGTNSYSPVISTTLSTKKILEFYQLEQPGSDLNVSFYAEESVPTQVTVFGLSGKIIFTKVLTPSKGYNDVSFNIGTLSSGLYVINLNNGTSTATKKFIK